jgi:hypothetical protein
LEKYHPTSISLFQERPDTISSALPQKRPLLLWNRPYLHYAGCCHSSGFATEMCPGAIVCIAPSPRCSFRKTAHTPVDPPVCRDPGLWLWGVFLHGLFTPLFSLHWVCQNLSSKPSAVGHQRPGRFTFAKTLLHGSNSNWPLVDYNSSHMVLLYWLLAPFHWLPGSHLFRTSIHSHTQQLQHFSACLLPRL